ncbi:MAG: oxidoreductase [Rhodomicrobium sp.]|nr:MAG: oxidoreductase [Rhodomicrobium sp.]
MPIIKDGAEVRDDPWLMLTDEMDVPTEGDVIIPLALASEKAERLSNHNGRIGIAIPNDVNIEDYAALIGTADLIQLELPAFTDGRAYSQARLLREELGFDKELRVKGDVLVDQAAYLKRCGFDSFDFDGPFDAEIWARTLSIISSGYQRNYRDSLKHRGA